MNLEDFSLLIMTEKMYFKWSETHALNVQPYIFKLQYIMVICGHPAEIPSSLDRMWLSVLNTFLLFVQKHGFIVELSKAACTAGRAVGANR